MSHDTSNPGNPLGLSRPEPPPAPPHVPLVPYRPEAGTAEENARRFYDVMRQRRSVRFFSDRAVSREVIESVCMAAATAPSGANKQPWRFVCVSDPTLKKKIRTGAEAEEREFYGRKANAEWLADLKPFDTTPDKEFLEVAPWLIVVFKMMKTDTGGQVYYANESVGIATGILLAAVHHAGLVALTHTPSPMAFLAELLQRPAHERPFLLIPVGYPAEGCVVPDIQRKSVGEVVVWR